MVEKEENIWVVRINAFWLIWCRERLKTTADFFFPAIDCDPLESTLQ
jgi:hypothetical protein